MSQIVHNTYVDIFKFDNGPSSMGSLIVETAKYLEEHYPDGNYPAITYGSHGTDLVLRVWDQKHP